MLLLTALFACAEPTVIDGAIDGHKLSEIQTAYYGGPFIIFATEAFDCMDMAWVSRSYDVYGEAPVDVDMNFLQIAFNSSDPSTGLYSMSGEAALVARFYSIEDNVYSDYRAYDGTFEIFEVKKEQMTGTMDMEFDVFGTLSGDWSAEFCVNVIE